MKKKRFIVGQSVRTLKQAEVGVPVAVVRQLKTPDSLWLGATDETLSSNR